MAVGQENLIIRTRFPRHKPPNLQVCQVCQASAKSDRLLGLSLAKVRRIVAKAGGKVDNVIKYGPDGKAIVGGVAVRTPKTGGVWKGSNRIPNSKAAQEIAPGGVRYTKQGFPDFSDHVHKDPTRPNLNAKVEIDMKGTQKRGEHDFNEANRKANIDDKYLEESGLTWHHSEDCKTMYLVKKDLHDQIPHTGAAAILRAAREEVRALNFAGSMIAPNTISAFKLFAAGAAGVGSIGKAVGADLFENTIGAIPNSIADAGGEALRMTENSFNQRVAKLEQMADAVQYGPPEHESLNRGSAMESKGDHSVALAWYLKARREATASGNKSALNSAQTPIKRNATIIMMDKDE